MYINSFKHHGNPCYYNIRDYCKGN